MAAAASDDYILGTDPVELERLRFQHSVWAEELRAGCARAGIGLGSRVVDLGCGPGFTSLELADVVGPGGRVVACDQSPRFLAYLRDVAARGGLGQVETREGQVEDLAFPPGSFDAAYARWLLCWLPRPEVVLARAAAALRTGGRVLVQDYVDWGSMRLLPRVDAFDRGVAACLAHWRKAGIRVDVMERLPALVDGTGLRVEALRPLPRLVRPGSPEWKWVSDFLVGYLPKVVKDGLLDDVGYTAFRDALEAASGADRFWLFTPAMAEAVLVKA